ncbi:hypothetical protein FHS85_004747 [Rhodoligotrophos appendicifer]|uniref:hypothetical protein n=1 Tax=Rhodoligotrophos appendicifer TaxID=987056 RepID=UPI00118642CA|nr:hypothetical protein [Rhodoligotrophos appendicifer]
MQWFRSGAIVAAIAPFLMISFSSQAQTLVDSSKRYTIEETADGGFIRLDQQTGGILKCSGRDGAMDCAPVKDDTASLRSEIEELRKENAELKTRISALEKAGGKSVGELMEPAEKQLNVIMGFFEDMFRRFFALTQTLKEKPGEDI